MIESRQSYSKESRVQFFGPPCRVLKMKRRFLASLSTSMHRQQSLLMKYLSKNCSVCCFP